MPVRSGIKEIRAVIDPPAVAVRAELDIHLAHPKSVRKSLTSN